MPAGANGVMFTPWLHGNRCPFEDPNARGVFFNLSLETGKSDMIRAVIEGVCYHLRGFMEAENKKVQSSEIIRFVGGGALSYATCQILSDVLGKKIETVDKPQNVGAVGAADVVNKRQRHHLRVLAQPPNVGLVACQAGTVDAALLSGTDTDGLTVLDVAN